MNKLVSINFKPNTRYLERDYHIVFERKYRLIFRTQGSGIKIWPLQLISCMIWDKILQLPYLSFFIYKWR